MKRCLLFVFFLLLFVPLVYSIPEEEIEVEPKFIKDEIGDEITFTITIHQICEENCKITIEDTKIELYDIEKISETSWKKIEEYTYQKTLKAKILSKDAKLRIIRPCPKYGTIVKDISFFSSDPESGEKENELPHISGGQLQSMTLKEVAKLYGIDTKDLISELGVSVSEDTTVRDLKNYGIKPFDVKEAATRATTAPTKKIESLPRSVVTGHANYFDILLVLALLSIATFAFFKKKFKVKYLTLGTFFLYDFYLREAHLCTVGAPQRVLLRFQELIKGHFPEWGLLFFVPILFTLVFGRIYCGFVCPYGAYQEFLSLITKKKLKIPEKIDKNTRYLKYLFLIVLLVSAIYFEEVVGEEYDPFKYLFRSQGSSITIALLVALTIASLIIYRPWCKYVCPLGAIYTLLSRISWFRIEYNKERCISCALCDRACGMQAIKCGEVNSYECIRCGDCLKACKHAVLSFVSNKKYAKFLGAGVVAVLVILALPYLYKAPVTPTSEVAVKDYVHKETGKVYVIPGVLGKDCTPCHASNKPSKRDLTSFAKDWVEHGRNFDAIAKLDSDKDGFTNEEEWNAGTNLADSSSHPK